ncbi:MAG TPA: pilus assembly protein N-terminal domain-containing protein [Rhizomicrobium sp.]|nr:pilus assembly protein N-terminal domain-containing protein [Rhizomicrobium sp.]
MRRALFAASLVLAAPAPVFAAGYGLAMDEVRTVTFEKPVATVYIGNPTIADINMIDASHAFLIGKAYGSTNIVALDSTGKQIFNAPVAVMARNDSSLVVNRGAQRTTYSCNTSNCVAVAEPGDGQDVFSQVSGQLAAHAAAARSAAQQNQ